MTALDVLMLKVEVRKETLKRKMAAINLQVNTVDKHIHSLHEEMKAIQHMAGQHMQRGLPAAALQYNSHRVSECHRKLVEYHQARLKMLDDKKDIQKALLLLDGKFKALQKKMEKMERMKASDLEKTLQKEMDDMLGGRRVLRA